MRLAPNFESMPVPPRYPSSLLDERIPDTSTGTGNERAWSFKCSFKYYLFSPLNDVQKDKGTNGDCPGLGKIAVLTVYFLE